jgi:DNA-binding MarR family transcriptional regulator
MNVRDIRMRLGLTQSEFARQFGIAIGTLRDWEQGRKLPDGPAQTLLRVIQVNPDAIRGALSGAGVPEPAVQVNAEEEPHDWLEIYLRQLRVDRPQLNEDAFLFRASITRIAETMDREFRTMAHARVGIGMGELRVLFALRRMHPTYQLAFADLFRHMLVASSTITKQVQRLEKRRLVERSERPGGRGLVVRLTPSGHRLVSTALAAGATAYGISETAFARAGTPDRASALRFLRTVVSEIETVRDVVNRPAQVALKPASIARR